VIYYYYYLLQLLADQLEPLTEQQLASICNQQQSSQEAEETLSQGMEIIQDSLAKTVASQLGRAGSSSSPSNAADHTAAALGKIGAMESLLQQVVISAILGDGFIHNSHEHDM
jgi:transcription factor TGA